MTIRLRAVNTALESENKIHDDGVAAEYGFRGGLVPGVTVYGYLAAAAVEHFGPDWLERGAMDARFHQPVYHDEEVEVSLQDSGDGRVCVSAGKCASGVAWLHDEQPVIVEESGLERKPPSIATLAPGIVLGTIAPRIDLAQARLSAPLAAELHGRAHPAILLGLANQVFVDNFHLGPWIHVGSEMRKFGSVKDGDQLRVRARVEERYERKGHEFVVLQVEIRRAAETVETVRHTAIWRPRISR